MALGQPAALKQQVDRRLRLELFFPPERPPALPPDLPWHDVAPGRRLAWLDRARAPAVLAGLDLDHLDDFRLYSATLEDLYLHYAAQP